MGLFDRIFGGSSSSSKDDKSHQLPSNMVAKEFGEVNVRKTASEIQVQFTILMEPQGKEAEGWQTGVALDASASMQGWYGRMLEGKVPTSVEKEYEKKGWIKTSSKDGRKTKQFEKAGYDDAIKNGYLKLTPNIVQSLARQFISYLASNLDADGGTTVIYWACNDGTAFEVVGDFTEIQCQSLDIEGPNGASFGTGTKLAPAVHYFVDRFKDAQRGMYIFITDGKLDDLDEVKRYTISLAKDIESGKRNSVKCVLIGVGDEIDISQMEELDDLDTGTSVDIWDHKIAKEMRALVEIFAEVVDENHLVASSGTIYDASGNIVKTYADGLPAKLSFSMSSASTWFELEVVGKRIRQNVT